MFCRYCGREIPDKAAFCGYCGRQVGPSPAVPGPAAAEPAGAKPPKKPPRKGKGLWVLLACILCAAAGAGLWFAAQHLPERSSDEAFEAYYEPFSQEDVILDGELPYVDSQLLLTAADGASFADVEALVGGYGGEIVGYISISNDYQILFPAGKDYAALTALAEELTSSRLVDEAMPNYVAELTTDAVAYDKDPWTDSGDPEDKSGSEWDEGQPRGNNWWAEAVKMPSVWQMDLKLSEVKVGVIDSMFDNGQKDLENAFVKLWNNPDDAYVRQQYEAVREKKKEDEGDNIYYHGTHVAGVIAAKAEDGFGITGVSQNARLYGYSVYGDSFGSRNLSSWSSPYQFKYAIALMLNEGVRVINISLALEGILSEADKGDKDALDEVEICSKTIERFLKTCLEKKYDFLIVKAAGNGHGRDAKYDIFGAIEDPAVKERILIVGACDYCAFVYYRAPCSNKGSRVDIYAPGAGVLSDVPGDRTRRLSGTSMAAPIVTGTAALVLGIAPDLTGANAAAIIRQARTKPVSFSVIQRAVFAGSISMEGSLMLLIREHVTSLQVPTAVALASIAARWTREKAAGPDQVGLLLGVAYHYDEEGLKELGNATVSVYDSEKKLVGQTKTLSIGKWADGSYEMFLPAGNYRIEASAEGYETTSEAVAVKTGETIQKDILLRPKGSGTESIAAGLVRTAYTYDGVCKMIGGETQTVSYRVPELVSTEPWAKSVSDAIWKAVYTDYIEASDSLNAVQSGQQPLVGAVRYEAARRGDVLSIMVEVEWWDAYELGYDYFPFYVSLSQKRQITAEEYLQGLISQPTLDRDSLVMAITKFVMDNVGTDCGSYVAASTTDEKLKKCMPFLANNSHLCAAAEVEIDGPYSPFIVALDLQTRERFVFSQD